MSTLRIATASTFGAINQSMTTVSAVVGTVTEGAEAMQDYVKDLRFKQKTDSTIMRKTYLHKAIEKAAESDLRRREELNKFLNAEENRVEEFKEIYDGYAKLFEEENKN